MNKSNTKKIGFWLLTIISALPFLGAGFSKLASQQMLVDEFTRWGFPLWFMYFTGVVEILGAVLLLIPKTRIWGALLLVVTMAVAIVVHLINNEVNAALAPLILGILPAVTGYIQYRIQSKKVTL